MQLFATSHEPSVMNFFDWETILLILPADAFPESIAKAVVYAMDLIASIIMEESAILNPTA